LFGSSVQFLAFGAQPPRCAIKFSQTVEDCTPNAKLCERLELDVFCGIVLLCCFQEPKDTRVDKILKGYKHGEAFMDSPSNELHLGQLTQHKLIALFEV
jgi:hypothetical protein